MDWHEHGTYVLALWLGSPRRISVGRLGDFDFPTGWYLYAGSARGPGGLQARIDRHQQRLADGKRLHWHIDYLRECAMWAAAWGRPSQEHLECIWAAELLSLTRARIVAPGFGASDCRCPAHLVHVPELPRDGWFADRLGAKDRYGN